MIWRIILGRFLILAACTITALLALYLGWIGGAFSASGFFGLAYTENERLVASLIVLAGIFLFGCGVAALWRPTKWLTVAAVILAAAILGLFSVSDGWSDDIAPFVLVFPVIIGGYYLGRPKSHVPMRH